jgi:hypothetical protein
MWSVLLRHILICVNVFHLGYKMEQRLAYHCWEIKLRFQSTGLYFLVVLIKVILRCEVCSDTMGYILF